MAASDASDRALNEELYGAPIPSFADTGPPPTTNQTPWDWLPESWQSPDDEEIRKLALASAAPSNAPGMMPPTAAPQPMPVDPYAQAVASLATSAPPAATPNAPPIAPPIGAIPVDPYASIPPIIGAPVDPYAAPQPMPVDLAPAPALMDPYASAPPLPGAAPMAPAIMPPLPSAPVVAAPPGDAPAPHSLAEYEDSPYARYRRELPALDHPTFDAEGKPIGASAESVARYIDEDPLQAAMLGERIRQARDLKFGAETHELEISRRKAELVAIEEDRAFVKSQRERSAQIDADAQRIANTKIDPSGRLSTRQRIFGVLGAIVGGLVQGRSGGRNAGMDGLEAIINRDIDAQKVDLDNARAGISTRRNTMIDEFKLHGDEARAEEAVRQAHYQMAISDIEFARQNYAQGGITDLKLKATGDAVLGAMQKAQSDALARATAANLAERKQRNDDLKTAAEAMLARANAAKAFGEVGSKKKVKPEDVVQPVDYWTHLHPANPIPPLPMSGKGYDSFLEERVKGGQLGKNALERTIGGEVTPLLDASGKVIGRKLGPITTAEGKPWVPNGTEVQVSKLQDKYVATNKLLVTLSAIRRIGPEWLSDTANSDKYQRLRQLAGTARLQAIAANDLGVPTGHDIELADNFLGTDNPTRRKDSLAGLLQAHETLVANMNVELQARGLDKLWNPPDLGAAPEAKNTPADDRKQRLLEKPRDTLDDAVKREVGARIGSRGYGLDLNDPGDQAIYADALGAAQKGVDSGVDHDQREQIEELGRRLASGGDGAAAARIVLDETARKGITSDVRNLAKEQIDAIERAKRPPPRGPASEGIAVPEELRLR